MKRLIIHVISSMSNGGAQEVLKTISDLSSSEYDHTVCYMRENNAYESDENKFVAHAIPLNINSIGALLDALKTIRSIAHESKAPVCLHGWMYHGNLLVLLVKLISPSSPVIFSIHNGSDRREFTSLSGFLASRICGWFSAMAKSTIFVSNKSLGCHVPYKNNIVIPNPIRLLKLVNDEAESRSLFLVPVVTLACVARFDQVKNIGFMLDVIQGLRSRGFPIQLLMAGGGMSAKNSVLMEMIHVRNLENSAELLGVVSDISSVYKRADYTILTSKCESFSNVLLESIACGVPFISSDVGIASDLVSSESSVIQGYDIAYWVDRLEQILQIRKTASISHSVSQHYKQVAETYAPKRIAKLYADCWAKAIEQ